MSFRYTRQHGDIACYYGNNLQYLASSITVAFDSESLTLFKIGPEHLVIEWAAKNRLTANGAFKVATITSREWEPETLNRFLDCSAYLGKFIEDQGLSPVALDDFVKQGPHPTT